MADDNVQTHNGELLTDKKERSIRRRQTVRVAVMVVTGGILLIWVLANREDTSVDWLFTTTTSPLIVVMLAAALLGFLFGYFSGRRSD